jgi:protocatechuate 3,4-dioxygenase beta subunit
MSPKFFQDRRALLSAGAFASVAFVASTQNALGFFGPGRFADELDQTPAQGEGPFYPDRLPLDTDNDLLILNNELTPASGEVTHLGGKITDVHGNPIRNVTIEIWQVDNTGAYIHSKSQNAEKRDKSFQGFGRFLTGQSGEYYFRTIKPVAYPGRPPHIHVAVNKGDQRLLTTQLYVAGDKRLERDGLFRDAPEKLRKLLLVEFKPLSDSKVGELTATFNIVLGATPDESNHGSLHHDHDHRFA